MSKFWVITVKTVLFLILLMFLPSCNNEDSTSKALETETVAIAPIPNQEAPLPAEGPLKILQFLPEGETPKVDQIVIMFNQPMVALGDFEKVLPPESLVITPPIEGQIRWLNQYTLAFVPDKAPTGGQTLTASLKPGLKSLSGATLAQGKDVSIILPPLSVLHSYKFRSPDPADDLTPSFTVYLSLDMDPTVLDSFAHFVYTDGEIHKIPSQWTRLPDDYYSNKYRVKCTTPIPPHTEYSLIIDSDIKNPGSPAVSSEDIEILKDQTHPPLTAEITSYYNNEDIGYYRNGDINQIIHNPEHALNIFFSNNVNLSEAFNHLEIEPPYPPLNELREKYKALADQIQKKQDNLAPALEDDEIIDNDDSLYNSYLVLWGAFKPDTNYKITIKPGLTDIYGQELGETLLSFLTTEFYPEVSFPAGFGLLETGTDTRLPVRITNLKEVTIEGYALDAAKAIELIYKSNFNQDYSYMTEGSELLNVLKSAGPPKTTILTPPNQAASGPVNLALDIKELFGPDLTGHFLVLNAIRKNHPDSKIWASSFIQITDIGLTIKVGRENSLIWTTNLVQGQSWPQVDLELRTATGQILWQGQSDKNGLALLPGGREILALTSNNTDIDFTHSNYSPLIYVIAKAGDQMSIWNLAWDSSVNLWNLNLYGNWLSPLNTAQKSFFLLNAQPLYKPGETVRFKMIGRNLDGEKADNFPAGEAKLIIEDPLGEVIDKSVVTISELGTLSYEFDLGPDSSSGLYKVSITTDPKLNFDDRSEFETVGYFTVQTYRTPAFQINFPDIPPSITMGDKIKIAVQAGYHFGSPVAKQPVEYSITRQPSFDFNLPGLSDFEIVNLITPDDNYGDSEDGFQEDSGAILSNQGTLDQNGEISIELDTKNDLLKPGPRLLGLYLTVTDVDSRNVSNFKQILLHPADLYVGLKNKSYVVQSDEPAQLELIVADPDGHLKSDTTVDLTLYRRVWNTVRRRVPGATYSYSSRATDEEVSKLSLTSQSKPVSFEMNATQSGLHWVKAVISDSNGRINESSTSFYVSGNNEPGWNFANNDTITLVADKPKYKPGDTAKIMVQSPFNSGEGLLTIERGDIRENRIFKVENHSPVLEIPLTEKDIPNIYVSVMLSRGRIDKFPDKNNIDLGKPAMRVGYLSLELTGNPDHLDVAVTTDKKEYKPGDEVTVDLKVTDSKDNPFTQGDVALVVVDAPLVQLSGDDVYYPEKLFSQIRPLSVLTANNLSSLIGRRNWGFKGANPGGGGGYDFDSSLIRNDFKSLAYFSPNLSLDNLGQAQVTFKLPDNLTTFKIYAIATGNGRLTGTGVSEILVTKNLLLRSSLPAYAGIGDEFTASVVVTNRGKDKGEAKIELLTTNLDFMEENVPKTVTVDSGKSTEIGYQVKALVGKTASLTFKVTMNDEQDQVVWSLPLSQPNQLTTQATYLQINPGVTPVAISLTPGYDPERGQLDLTISPSLVNIITQPYAWLINYPYGCVEQSTSKAFGNLAWYRLKDRLPHSPDEEKNVIENINSHLKKLSQWHIRGGYNYWPDQTSSSSRSLYLSTYVLDFLISAKEAGFEVSPNLIEEVSNFLLEYINDSNQISRIQNLTNSNPRKDSLKSEIIYALTTLSRRGDNSVSGYIEEIYINRNSLSLTNLLNLTRAINNLPKSQNRTKQLTALLPMIVNHLEIGAGNIQPKAGTTYLPHLWQNQTQVTALTLITLCEAAPFHEFIPGLVNTLVSRAKNGNFGSTYATSTALSALANYIEIKEPEKPDLTITATYGQNEILKGVFNTYTAPEISNSLPINTLTPGDSDITLSANGQGQLWSAVSLTSAPIEPDLSPVSSTGMVLSRSYSIIKPDQTSPGQTLFKRGQLVKITITLMTPAPRYQLLLEDRLPAGFEPINFNLNDADQTLLPNLYDKSEDWHNWYDHQQIRFDKIILHSEFLPAGAYSYSYLARATTAGTYITPGPIAEEMYAPENFSRGGGQKMIILNN